MSNLKVVADGTERLIEEIIKEDPFGSKDDLDAHLKHRDENPETAGMTDDEFNHMGDYLYDKEVDNKNIFGYMTKRKGKIRYCKWDKSTRIFVCYAYFGGKPTTVSEYKKSEKNYKSDEARQSIGEIPPGK